MKRRRDERGFAMLLVFLMAALIAVSLYNEIPRVSFESQRAKEQLLIERGEQYKRAIQVFVRANKKYPSSIQELESFNNHRYLRKQYIDPMTGKKEWRLVHIGPGGVFTDSLVNKPKDDKDKEKKGETTTTTQNFIDPNNPNATGQPQGPSAVPPRRQSEMGGLMPGGMPGQAGYGAVPQIDPATGQPVVQPAVPGQPPVPGTAYPTGMPTVPGQPVQPGQVVPGQPYPVSPYPVRPGQVIPGQPYPQSGQVIPGQPYPVQPGQVIPGQPYPQPGQVIPGQPYPQSGQMIPGQPYPVQPGQVIPGQPYPMQPGQVIPGQYPVQPGGIPTQTPQPGMPGFPYSTQPGAQGAGSTPFTQPGMMPATGGGPTSPNDAQKMIQDLLTRPRTGTPAQTNAPPGQQIGGGIAGVASNADAEGIKIYNEKTNYKEWEFLYDYTKDRGPAGAPNSGIGTPAQQLGTTPGQPAGPGTTTQPTQPGQPMQPGQAMPNSPFGQMPGAAPGIFQPPRK